MPGVRTAITAGYDLPVFDAAALPDAPGSGRVSSVDGQTGDVNLGALYVARPPNNTPTGAGPRKQANGTIVWTVDGGGTVTPTGVAAAQGKTLTPTGPVRDQGAAQFQALGMWLRDPWAEVAVAAIGDSTATSPGTVDLGAIGGATAYIRTPDQAAIMLAARYPNIRVELHALDYTNQPLATLAAAAAAGATTITSATSFPAGTLLELDRGYGNAEQVVTTGAPTANGAQWNLPVPALASSHLNGAYLSGPGAPGGVDAPPYQTVRVLSAGQGRCYCSLPGSSGQQLSLPVTPRAQLRGSGAYFFAVELDPAPSMGWAPTAARNLFGQQAGAGSYGAWLDLNTDGRLRFRHSPDGNTLLTRSSTVVVPGVVGTPRRVGVLANLNNAGQQTFSFYTRLYGERTWTLLDTVTAAGTSTWFNPPGIRWTVGGQSALFTGDVYGVELRRGGLYGPTMLPTSPSQWHWGNSDVGLGQLAPIKGGPVLKWYSAGWPGKGLAEFDNAAYLQQILPHDPYLAVVLVDGHNDAALLWPEDRAKLDAVLDRIDSRVPGQARIAVTTQNPTIRTDGPAGNPLSLQRDARLRMALRAGHAQAHGLAVIDTYAVYLDYVTGCAAGTRSPVAFKPDNVTPGDGTMSDLLHYDGAGQVGVHPKDAVVAGTRVPGGCYLPALDWMDELTR